MSRDYLKQEEYKGDPMWLEYLGYVSFAIFMIVLFFI